MARGDLSRLTTPTLVKMLIGSAFKQMGDWFYPRAAFGSGTWFSLPRTGYHYAAEVGDGLGSSVITPVIQWLMRSFPEAPLVVRERTADELEIVPDHPLATLVERPNTFYPGTLLWMTTLSDWCWFGESYWRILYQRGGRPGELWWLPPWSIAPKWPSDGSQFISHYEYAPDQGTAIRLDLDEVIHFRHGLDPRNPRHGLPPLRAIVREIWSDDEASNFVGSLLRNMGIPGLILSPKASDDMSVGESEVERVKDYVKGRFTGDARGEPLVLGGPTQVDRLSWSPTEMDLSVVRNTAEERVSAALGIPSAVVGFHSGLENSKVGATMHEFVRLAWHNGIVPVQRLMAAELQRILLPQFEPDPARYLIGFDYDEVEALQESRDDLAKRYHLLVTGGLLKVSEGRQALGYDSDPEDEIYLRPNNVTPTDPKDQMPEPEPMPLVLPPGNPLANSNGNGTVARQRRNDNQPLEQRALKQGTLEELIQGAVRRSAQRLEKPPARLTKLATRIWREEQQRYPQFQRMVTEVLKDYGLMVATASREVLQPKQSFDDMLRMSVIHERLPLTVVRFELAEVYAQMYGILADLTLQAIKDAMDIELTDPDHIKTMIQHYSRERVALLDLTSESRQSILQTLESAREQGLDEDSMIRLLQERVPAGRWTSIETRAQVIVRSEGRFASNQTTAEYARQVGARLLVFDARLGSTDQTCEERAGWIIKASEAMALAATEHPNGTLGFAPLMESVIQAEGVG